MSRPLRIAVIEPDPFGGLLHYSTQMADALAARGHEVSLVVPRDNELVGRAGAARRRAVLAAEPPPAPENPSRAQVLRRRGRTAARIARTWWRIAREVRAGRYDVVLLGGSIDLSLAAVGALLFMRVKGPTPVVHLGHNVRPFNRFGGGDLYIESGLVVDLLARLYPRFALVLVHGERSRDEFARTWPPVPLAIIPHGDEGLFAEQPPPPSSEPRVLFFGNWTRVKGLPVLMAAFDLLAEHAPEARLTIAGPPLTEDGVASEVRAWAASRTDRVEVIDEYVPVEAVRDVFARARVVALPYLTVYQSGVVHLAMTMARAVVVSDVGELSTVVADGESGFVVASEDPPALAEGLRTVLSDPGLAARMGAAGRLRVEQGASWETVAARVEEAIAPLSGGG